MAKVKITVLKTLNMNDLYGDNLPCDLDESFTPTCPRLSEGQEFISEEGDYPPGFCAWAFTDIYRDISLCRLGGLDNKVLVSCCSDGVRPVTFKVERIED